MINKLGIFSIAWLVFAANMVVAQTSAPAQGSSTAQESSALEEIIVTARRKDENLERVPVAITALSAAQLSEQSIRTEADLQSAVPGLVIRQNQSQTQFNYSIRGQSVDSFSGSPPGVLPYIDEVQVSAPVATSFYDLESIQVLKGPQGTLFGRNTTGGAVLYNTVAPTDKFESYLDVRVGNEDTREYQGAINLPIVSEKILLRLSGDILQDQGYEKNLYNNQWLGADDTKSGRASLRLQLTDDLRNDTIFQYSSFGGSVAQPVLWSVNQCGAKNNGFTLNSQAACLYGPANPLFPGFLAANPGAFPGGLSANVGYQAGLGPYVTDSDYPNLNKGWAEYFVNKTQYQINPDLLIKNIFGDTNSRSTITTDIDGTSYPIFQTGTQTKVAFEEYQTQQLSEELQLQGKAVSGALDYIVGGYYARESDPVIFDISFFGFEPFFPATPALYNYTTTDKTSAVFEQVSYHLGAGFSLTEGYRYTWEKNEISQLPGSIYYGASAQHSSSSDPSWNFSLEYQQSQDLMLYVATRGSWRTGGFNGVSPPVNAPASADGNVFYPETTHDVELGEKFAGLIGNMPVRLNAAAYVQWVDNIQRVDIVVVNANLASLTVNVPQATVTGFEFDGQVNPLHWLTLGATLAYTDARFNKPTVSLFGQDTNFGPYADTPRWAGSLYMQAQKNLPNQAGVLGARVDAYAQSGQWFSNLGNTYEPNTDLPSYSLLNMRLDWRDIYGTKVTPSLYVRNIADRRYYVGGVPQGGAVGLNDAAPGRPRTFGLEVRYAF
jgi:iron complex outermembrane receptor protein